MKSREADLPHRPPKPIFLQVSLHTGRSTVLREQPQPPEAAAHQALRPQALPAQTPVSRHLALLLLTWMQTRDRKLSVRLCDHLCSLRAHT